MSKRWSGVQKHRGFVRERAKITIARGREALLFLALAGCAAVPRPVAQAPAGPAAAGPDEGTVAVVRPIGPGGAAAETPRADILTAMGVSPAAALTRPLAEIIVRTDDGATLSVVQSDAADFEPGERVGIIAGGPPRLLPLASVSPAS